MAIKEKTVILKDSEGKSISINTKTFAGSFGVELFSKVFLLMLPMIAPMLNKKDKKSLIEAELDMSSIASSITSRINEDEIVELVLKLCSTTLANDGKLAHDLSSKLTFDDFFSAEYALLFHVIKFVLEVNFKSFLAEGGINLLIGMIPGIVEK